MSGVVQFTTLTPGQLIVLGGDLGFVVSEKLAKDFQPGDHLLPVLPSNGTAAQVLHVPKSAQVVSKEAVTKALEAWEEMKSVPDQKIVAFYDLAAKALSTDSVWSEIERINAADVATALADGRSTTRLKVSDSMRKLMIDGLHTWSSIPPTQGRTLETVSHGSWQCHLVTAPLGVIAFVFEGRPNVVVDAVGVLRGGNSVVFRIGRDAFQTAQCIMDTVVKPCLLQSGLPENAVVLVQDKTHASAWSLFRDNRLGLAVARGSGASVNTLGSIARSVGVPVSLHGTGGAWMILSNTSPQSPENITLAVTNSLDRKVCNTLNTVVVVGNTGFEKYVVEGLIKASEIRKAKFIIHVEAGETARKVRAVLTSQQQECVREFTDNAIGLSTEREWENDPEIAICFKDTVAEAVATFNRFSPKFVLSLLSTDPQEHDSVFLAADAPFVSPGITRWVDGQYALKRPEMGLTNWESGRLFGRGGILTADGVYAVKTRVTGDLWSK